jgi:hypothetical protein
MKKSVIPFFVFLSIYTLSLLAVTNFVSSYNNGYQVIDYPIENSLTLDGTWSSPNEWEDTYPTKLEGSLNASFRVKYSGSPDSSAITQYFLIECFNDKTDNGGDYWQICYAASTSPNGTPIGGTTPQTDCLRIDFKGHDGTSNTKVYRGNGEEWILLSNEEWQGHIQIAQSIDSSPDNEKPHWIAEIEVDHQHFNLWPETWIRIAVHDDNNELGYQKWPPEANRDIPDQYGLLKLETTSPSPTPSPTTTPATPTPSPTDIGPTPTPTNPELSWTTALTVPAIILLGLIPLKIKRKQTPLQKN